jgi:hypothetical protein
MVNNLVILGGLAKICSSFTVNITRREVYEPLTPIHHMLSNYKTEKIHLGKSNGGDFTINMVDNSNLAYTGPVFVGTPL